MSTYVKAVLKVANNDFMVGKNNDVEDVVVKCLSAGFQLFTWEDHIFLILGTKLESQNSVNFCGKKYVWVQTPFDLGDFEV